MISTYTGRMGSTKRIMFAVLFSTIGCSTATYTTDRVATQELNIEKSRRIAEDFVRSHPDFIKHNGQDLTLIAEGALRCRLCWAFDFRYTILVNGKLREEYVTVTVQEGKASLAIPEKEGTPPGQ